MSASLRGAIMALLLSLLLHSSAVAGAFINYHNCLESSIVNSNPLQLQFIPLFFDAKFERKSPYNLDVTIYGNVSGQQYVGTYPPPDSPHWKNNNASANLGKIPVYGDAHVYTTLFADFKVLSYTAYNARASSFCPHLVNASCPLGPSFYANSSNPYDLPAFTLSHGFGSPYEFSTLSPTITIVSGDNNSPPLGCISTSITPDLGPQITNLITWLPAAILIMKGIATLVAAIWSPWGSSDIFRWSSNYGRDEDLLRLVTPGFGDCLQYIQFVALMGGLTLSFPGFFRPAVSQMSWSLLLFNSSFVSHGPGTQSLIDGIYVTNGNYGLDIMQELIGMTKPEDVWASMAIWLAVIAGAVIVLCQVGFFARWIYRSINNTKEEDLRRKNIPFTVGNMIRLLFNYFILPIVALSLFQLVISPTSNAIVVAFAAVLLAIVVAGAAWIMRFIFTTKPRPFLFDDMPTVLLYGPLYNTYSDSAAPFALVPVIITFMRGVAFGAVQPSGIGQIIILAICEVILILTLNAFRPFQNQTSMNAYHTFFSVVRLISVLLCVAFVPSLGVNEAPRGWIGYAILLLHGCVLVFGFFLNAAQTMVEVAARSWGLAGREAQTGAMRGSILTWRQLKKRKARPTKVDRASMASNAAMLRTSQGDEAQSYNGRRSRSMSASSQQLLNQGGLTTNVNRMSGLENFSNGGDLTMSPSVDADGVTGFSFAPSGGPGKPELGVRTEETFYRAPRPRKNTIEPPEPGAKSRSVGGAHEFPYQDAAGKVAAKRGSASSPAPAYLRERTDSDAEVPRTDYAVREVDQYYRGPALSDQPTRKLKTGPADPEGPAANAQSWLQRLVFGVKGNKSKDQGKGFEVVRSSRMPPGMQQQEGPVDESVEMQTSPPMHQEPYRDLPEDERAADIRTATAVERPVSPLTEEQRQQADRARPRLVSYGSEDSPRSGPRVSGVSRISGRGNRSLRPDSDTIAQAQIASAAATAAIDAGPEQPSLGPSLQPRPSHDTQRSSQYDGSHLPSEPDDEFRQYRLSEVPPSLGPIDIGSDLHLPSRFNSGRSANVNAAAGYASVDNANRSWLADVDDLNWSHNQSSSRSQPTATSNPPAGAATSRYQHYGSTLLPAPGIPRKSSRRESGGTPTGHTPTGSMSATARQGVTGGAVEDFDFQNFDFDSTTVTPAAAYGRNDDDPHRPPVPTTSYFLDPDEDDEGSRPSSFMNASHHRAADSIHRNSFGANAALQASSAEFMGGTGTGSTSPPDNHGASGGVGR